MSEKFEPITSQEQFDTMVQQRIKREQEKLANQYGDYDQVKAKNEQLEKEVGELRPTLAQLKNAAAEHDKTVSDLNAKIAGYETTNLRTKIAYQKGLPLDLAERLVGDDEESITADADRLASFIKPSQPPVPPLKSVEDKHGSNKDGAYQSLLENMNLEGE